MLVVFAASNLLVSVLPTFGELLVVRFVSGLPHAAYLGPAALVAASLMGEGRRARGVAFVSLGLTLATVVGVPFGAYAGQHLGWRSVFVASAVIFAAALAAVGAAVPFRPADASANLRSELTAFALPQVWFALARAGRDRRRRRACLAGLGPDAGPAVGCPAAGCPAGGGRAERGRGERSLDAQCPKSHYCAVTSLSDCFGRYAVIQRRSTVLVMGVACAAALSLGLAGASPASASSAGPSTHSGGAIGSAGVGPVTTGVRSVNYTFDVPPTTATCQAAAGISCYNPQQLRTAYDLAPLYAKGLNGKGRTIAIVDSFGSPTIKADLAQFDADFGLPDPPKFDIIQPAGAVPPFDATNPDHVGWAQETTLDIEWAHAIAPGANLLLVETPVAETEGTTGIPEIVKAENYVIDHGLADVISQSFGATEQTFPSKKSLLDLRGSFINAARHGVTVLASSGDAGPTDYQLDGENLYTFPVNSWPSSDPLVTSVGGTQLHLDAIGNRLAPDNVWNDTALLGGPAASGGGLSSVFSRPEYQDVVRRVVGNHRGTPDISMSAAVDGGVLVYTSFGGFRAGYHIFGGTSESSPLFSGVVAIAAQAAHHRLGLINPAVYELGAHRARGIVDVTAGDNTVTFDQAGSTYTVQGSAAVPGYDLATGWGTLDVAKFVPELADN